LFLLALERLNTHSQGFNLEQIPSGRKEDFVSDVYDYGTMNLPEDVFLLRMDQRQVTYSSNSSVAHPGNEQPVT
jgi:hypothetical protein